MRVFGKSTYPTVQWLRETLAPIQLDRDLAWGVTKPYCIGGQTKILGLSQLLTLKEAGVSVPSFYATPTRPFVGRMNNHTQGRYIFFPDHPRWTKADYWISWIPSESIKNEWRVTVAGSTYLGSAKTMYIGKKVPIGTPLPNTLPVRSRRFGWAVNFTEKPPKGLRPLARKAVDALGYDFGAVDVLELTSGEFLVLEVNSAFAMRSPLTRRRFLQTLLLRHPYLPLETHEQADHLLASINKE